MKTKKESTQKGISEQNHKDNMIEMQRIARENGTLIETEKGCFVVKDKSGKKYYDYGPKFF